MRKNPRGRARILFGDTGKTAIEPIGGLPYSSHMFAVAENIGVGIYSTAEAAFYARVSRQIMNRWVFGDSKGKPVIERQLVGSDEKVVTFLDFVQTLAVREVRNRHGISLQKIRQGVDAARERYRIEYPLACEHTIFLFSDRKGEGHGEIVIRLSSEEADVKEQYVQLTGKARENLMMKQVVELFLDDLKFDPATGLAIEFSPMANGAASIVLNPRLRFGEPIVNPSGYTVESLWHATNTEGGIQEAAAAYGVGRAEVELANKYYDMLMPSRGA